MRTNKKENKLLRQQDKIIIWPAYFDASKTRRQGRQVSKNLAVGVPRAQEVKEAADKLGFASEIVPDVAYSKVSNVKTSMILIKKRGPKNQAVKNIARQIVQMRNLSAQK